jgi:hypothetical protein
VTLVSVGAALGKALDAAAELAAEGVEAYPSGQTMLPRRR